MNFPPVVAFHQDIAAISGRKLRGFFVVSHLPRIAPEETHSLPAMISRLFLLLLLASPISAQDGQQLYTLYCSACHGADGKGATAGTFPPLSESPWVAGDADRAVKITLKGLTGPVDVLGKTYNLEMPPQGAVLPDDQLAAILTYVRSAWGNSGSAVTADFVKTVRASVSSRATPWTAEEILKLHPLPLEKTALTNLLSQTYSGKWSSLPDFSKLKAENVEEEHDGVLSLKDSPLKDDFAVVWQGSFEAPADGDYEFLMDVDDAAALFLNGKKVVEITGIGPMDGSRARKGKAKLTKGSHPFRLEYLEIKNNEGISLGWRGPGIKNWKWLSENTSKPKKVHEPIPITPTNGRPVIYRNFIAGTTPRAIGVGFPGGLNLAYSADNLAPELLWTGAFIDGAPKWLERGTDNNPPAGDHVVSLSKNRFLPKNARFRGYKLDPEGNPTFSIQVGERFLLDSWKTGTTKCNTLIRTLTFQGGSSSEPVEFLIAGNYSGFGYQINGGPGPGGQPMPFQLEITNNAADYSLEISSEQQLKLHDDKRYVLLFSGKSVTLTYRWK